MDDEKKEIALNEQRSQQRQEFLEWLDSIKKEKLKTLQEVVLPEKRENIPKVTVPKEKRLDEVALIDLKAFENIQVMDVTIPNQIPEFSAEIDKELFQNISATPINLPQRLFGFTYGVNNKFYENVNLHVIPIENFDAVSGGKESFPVISKDNLPVVKIDKCVIPRKVEYSQDNKVLTKYCRIDVPEVDIDLEHGRKINLANILEQVEFPTMQNGIIKEDIVPIGKIDVMKQVPTEIKTDFFEEVQLRIGELESIQSLQTNNLEFQYGIDLERFEKISLKKRMLLQSMRFRTFFSKVDVSKVKDISVPDISQLPVPSMLEFSYKIETEKMDIPQITCPSKDVIFDVLKTM